MGYVLKSASADLLIEAVRTVAAGRPYLARPSRSAPSSTFVQRTTSGSLDVYDTLTKREVEIFKWMAQGYKNAEISARLSISPRTVEVHRARIMQKLDLSSQAISSSALPSSAEYSHGTTRKLRQSPYRNYVLSLMYLHCGIAR